MSNSASKAQTPCALIVMGVSGCGKTTFAQALHQALVAKGKPSQCLDADDFHPPANVQKMSAGHALNDEDRAPWLARLNQELQIIIGRQTYAVLACSALKERYRKALGEGIQNTRFIHLHGSFELIEARMKARQHKYMPASLLRSQFDALEVPEQAITLDVALPIAQLVQQALNELDTTLIKPTKQQ